MPKDRLSNRELQEMFEEGQLIGRALITEVRYSSKGIKHDLSEIDFEVNTLNTKRVNGIHGNVERDGQRNRSATLLVPDVEMSLFQSVGFLYDADKSTTRGYMFHDETTLSGTGHESFYNINEDKAKFEPILSRKKFVEKYQEYRRETDGTDKAHVKYNEVLANFTPQSLVGLVARDNYSASKLKLLAVKSQMAETHDIDLPMTIMNKGKIEIWNPDLKEISQLLNYSKEEVVKYSKRHPDKSKEELLENYVQTLGFSIKVTDFNKDITPNDITVLNKNESTAKEVVDFLHTVTAIPKGGKFAYGIEGRLKEVVNNRRESEGLKTVKSLDNIIINKKDIGDLVAMLDKELALDSKRHKSISTEEGRKLTNSIMSEIDSQRPSKSTPPANELEKIKEIFSDNKNSNLLKTKEFLNKVVSLFKKNIITKRILVKMDTSKSR